MNKSRTYINKLADNTGKSVMIKGWVETASSVIREKILVDNVSKF